MQESFTGARRRMLTMLAAAPWALASMPALSAAPAVSVFKLNGCGCCDLWADHLRKNGFAVSVQAFPDLAPVRVKYGIPNIFDTCHMALVEGYAIEGHVPAVDIQRLLRSKPKVAGLAVPACPPDRRGWRGRAAIPMRCWRSIAMAERGSMRVIDSRLRPAHARNRLRPAGDKPFLVDGSTTFFLNHI